MISEASRVLTREKFAKLNAKAKGEALDSLSKLVEDEFEDSRQGWRKALLGLRQLIALGGQAQVFNSLNADGKSTILHAISMSGVAEVMLEDNRLGWRRALKWQKLAVALGGQAKEFSEINEGGKSAVLISLTNASVNERRLDDNPEGWKKALKWCQQAVVLGGQPQVFSHLRADGKEAILLSLRNAGLFERLIANNREGMHKSVDWCLLAVELGETQWNEDGVVLPDWAGSLFDVALSLAMSGRTMKGWLSVWGGLSEHQWIKDYHVLFAKATGLLDPREALDGADLWLQRSHIWGANPKLSEHSHTVVEMARVRLAQVMQTQRKNAVISWSLHERWPVNFEGLGHWVLAHVAVFAPHLLPPSADTGAAELGRWQPDVQAIANVLRWKELWTDEESYRAPHYLTDLLPSDRIHFARYGCTAEHQEEMRSWFSALHAGDPQPMAEALQAAWLGLMDDQLTRAERLCQWLMRQGVDETSAWQRTRDAFLTARCDGLLQEVLEQRWDKPSKSRAAYRSVENARLTEAAAATRGHTPHQASMQRNLRFFANASLDQMLGADAAYGPADVDRLWELLQMQRLGVALAIKPKRVADWSAVQGLTWDRQAEISIRAMQSQLLYRAKAHEEARQRGEHLPKAYERNEPLEPFATYAREWRRMGWDLVLPTPQQTADCLREGQALVQCHLSEDGSLLHALVLRPGYGIKTALSLHELASDGLDVQAVTGAVQLWQKALVELDAVPTNEQSTALNIYALSQPMQALQSQWQSWQEPGHPLQAVMRWLHEQAPKGVVCVWPQAWSSLPWQALWEQAFERAEPLRCVGSVGAWVQAQERAKQESGATGQALDPVVFSSLDVWDDGGESEVKNIASTLGVQSQADNDLGEVLKALKARGPVHLAMHGQFDAMDPLRSALVVEQKADEGLSTRGVRLHVRKVHKASPQQDQAGKAQNQPTAVPSAADEHDDPVVFETAYLPAWALSQMEIQADITLGVCESVLEGQGVGQAAQLGAAGFGAMLMAAGARSVTGSLWACDTWSAALFFDFWYEERREHPAARALQKARQRLRVLEEESFLDRVGEASPEARESAEQRCALASQLGWAKPFDHPSCWAAFALLGDAPALTQLKPADAPKTSVVKASMGLMASLWRRWRPTLPK